MRNCVFFLSLILVILGGMLRVNSQNIKKTSPRQAVEKSTAVFSGKITSVAPGKQRLRNLLEGSGNLFDDGELLTAEVKIEKMFRRAEGYGLSEGDSLYLYPPRDCRINFKTNENWLFYVRYDVETFSWEISDCYRTRILTDAPDDLKFFEDLPNSLQRSRVSGRVAQMLVPPTKTEKGVYKPVAGVEIVATIENYNVNPPTKQEFFAKTDENGVYEIYDIPDGIPSITLKNQDYSRIHEAETFGVSDDYSRKEKPSRGMDIYFSLGYSIVKGKVTDADGKPLLNIKVQMIPIEKDAEDLYNERTVTDENGNYTIKVATQKIRGRYIVAANDEIYREPKPPYAAAYFPSATDFKAARLVAPKDNQTLENIDINLGAKLTKKSVSGKVFFNDGSEIPAGKVIFDGTMNVERIYNSDFERSFIFPDNADVSNGKFLLKTLEKRSGKLQAELLFKREILEGCLKRKLNLPPRQNHVLVVSKPVYLTNGKNNGKINLKFLIPPCKALTEAESDAYWLKKMTAPFFYGYTRYGKKVVPPNYLTEAEREKISRENQYTNEYEPSGYDSYAPENFLADSSIAIAGTVEKSLAEAPDAESEGFQISPAAFESMLLVRVDKIYKGGEIYGIEAGDKILVGDMFSAYEKLERNKKYLFFLRSWNNFESFWHIPDSNKLKPFAQAQSYVRAFESPAKTGRRRISGYVKLEKIKSQRLYSSISDRFQDEPLVGVNVILMPKDPTPENLKNFPASRYFKTVTDADGFYEFNDLLPGNYWILTSTPQYRFNGGSQVFGKVTNDEKRLGSLIDLTGKDNAGVDFYVYYRGEIKGKILDEKGNPVGQAMVKILDAKTLKPLDFAAEQFTTPKGEFSFGGIPDGKYLLVVLPAEPINFKAAFRTVYYPNAPAPQQAVPIEIVKGGKKENINITVLERLPEKNVSGTILFPNDIAAKNDVFLTFDGAWEFILLKSDYQQFFSDLRTKPFEAKIENGKFNVSIPEGATGKMQAYALIKSGKAAECLKNQVLPKADENGFVKIYSKSLDLTINRNVENLKLQFIAPESCFEK